MTLPFVLQLVFVVLPVSLVSVQLHWCPDLQWDLPSSPVNVAMIRDDSKQVKVYSDISGPCLGRGRIVLRHGFKQISACTFYTNSFTNGRDQDGD